MIPLENPAVLNQPPVTPSKWKPRTPRLFPKFLERLPLPPSRPSSSLYLSLLRARYTFRSASLRATIPRFRLCSSVLVPLELRPRLPLTLPGSLIPFQPSRWTVSTDVVWTARLPFSLFPVFSLSSFYLLRSIRLPAQPHAPSRCSEGVGRLAARLTTCSTANPPTSSLLPLLLGLPCSALLLYPRGSFSFIPPSQFLFLSLSLSRFDSLLLRGSCL